MSISVYWVEDGFFSDLVSGFVYSGLCVVGSRILLSLRDVAEREGKGGTLPSRYDRYEMSDIHFDDSYY